MKIERIRLREDNANVTLTAYIQDDSPEMLNGKKRPAVLVCPGGGFLYCSDREAEPIALRFAAMGYHAFVLRYSCYFSSYAEMKYDIPLEKREHVGFPRCVQDIGLAMQEIHRHAEEWRLDADRIAITGYSAGALNCALYGVYWNKPLITECLGAGSGFAPAVMILGYGVYDNCVADGTNILNYKDLNDAYLTALTGNPTPDLSERRKVSPVYLIDEEFPPTFLWATFQDNTVPSIQTIKMANALVAYGIPTELHFFEKGFHGLALATQATSAARSCIIPDVALWIDMAERWMDSRFLLPLPEKMEWEIT